MLRLAALATALLITVACGSSTPTTPSGTSGRIVFTAQLSPINVVPPVTNADATGTGQATITFTVPRDSSGAVTGDGTVNFSVPLRGFPSGTVIRGAHIHSGVPGVAGPVVVDTGLSPTAPVILTDGTGTLAIEAALTRDQASQIAANPANFYFNVRTALNPDGAIRGQLVRQ